MAVKKMQVYTVRNLSGQFIGTFRALSPAAAIRAHIDYQRTYASTFRRSHGVRPSDVDPANYRADIEQA